MKMTLAEALACPPRMTFDEWGEYITQSKKIDKQIGKYSEDVYYLNYVIEEILSDEVGSDRYNKKLIEREKAQKKLNRLYQKRKELDDKYLWKTQKH